MIEKLSDELAIDENGNKVRLVYDNEMIVDKINEIIDVVNQLNEPEQSLIRGMCENGFRK